MPLDSVAPLMEALRRGRLLEPAQAEELGGLPAKFPEPRTLAAELIRRGWLTPYQANQILQGRGDGLLLGSYVLLERLGEGGMGQVFKARNWKLGRVVALKLIRKERLSNPDALRRFHREIRAAAQLDHPNIVRAYDADEAGGAHFFVMEYVEGTDLARLVQRQGPLAVERACDCARQAALGLQHAFERGIVHRDVKPQNLLLTPQGIIKILDMGLARLSHAEDEGTSLVTQEGAVMGTPDYMAPEQTLDSHAVDVRADLYSLGGTLYFLLTGKVPFPGGSLGEKIAKHQMREPTPVEQFRPGTPAGVAAVLRKLMAKRPEDRYQTPAEAAAALGSAGPSETGSLGATVAEGPAPGFVAPEGFSRLDDQRTPDPAGADTSPPAAAAPRRRRPPVSWRRFASYAVGGLLSLVLAAVFLLLILHFTPPAMKPPPPEPKTEAQAATTAPPEGPKNEAPPTPPAPPAPEPPPPTFDQWVQDTAALPADGQIQAVIAKLKELNPDFDGDVKPIVTGASVTGLTFVTDHVTDIRPLRALPRLKNLSCAGSAAGMGRLSDLSPLQGLGLTSLGCSYNPSLTDLSPLKGAPLIHLGCGWTGVTDLSPLEKAPLQTLYCGATGVADLSPLKGAPLATLNVKATRVPDLSPLKEFPLKVLGCDFLPWRDADLLRSIGTLEEINGKPAAEFWKDVDARRAAFEAWAAEVAAMPAEKQAEAVAARLKERNPDFPGEVKPTIEGGVVTGLEFPGGDVTDLEPVCALKGLRSLVCTFAPGPRGKLADLGPLWGLPLTRLVVAHSLVADLRPLRGMPLTTLGLAGAPVRDLSPLKGMALTYLNCNNTAVGDLSPLVDMPIHDLYCEKTAVVDLSPIQHMPLVRLMCDYQPSRDADILRSIPTLKQINQKPAADFWKEADGSPPPRP